MRWLEGSGLVSARPASDGPPAPAPGNPSARLLLLDGEGGQEDRHGQHQRDH